MDAVRNPYSPGAGSPPPELAGRGSLLRDAEVAIARIRQGRSAQSIIMVGLRGVGKTVLLDKMRLDAEEAGIQTLRLETAEDRSLPSILAPELRLALLRLSRVERAKVFAEKGLKALTGFARSLKVKYADIEVAFDLPGESGLADNGDLESDLTALLQEVAYAAQSAQTAAVLFLDEMQYLREAEFRALISALHRCAQRQLPMTLIGAGLPQLRGLAGQAKSYAERLFAFPLVGALIETDARDALVKPAQQEGVEFTEDAVQEILHQTHGYPYFLQEWGKHAWEIATGEVIRVEDVFQANLLAQAALDSSFFLVRFDRMTPTGKRYVRAMAELGEGPHRSGDIAFILTRSVQALAPIRSALIKTGMIWSPAHGDNAFTVPLFGDFMKRIMPGNDWRGI
ncbi:MAG TPA: ATP-binding protein [Acidisarcina sp.]